MTPVGIVEIAERLGVQRSTVDKWRERSSPLSPDFLPVPLPKPKWIVGGRPAWSLADIERWARKTGRL